MLNPSILIRDRAFLDIHSESGLEIFLSFPSLWTMSILRCAQVSRVPCTSLNGLHVSVSVPWARQGASVPLRIRRQSLDNKITYGGAHELKVRHHQTQFTKHLTALANIWMVEGRNTRWSKRLANASYWDNHMWHFPVSQILLETLSGKCKELCLLRRRWMRGLGQGWFQDSEECQLCRRAAGRGGRIDLRAPEQVLPSWPWPCCACPGAWRGGR